MPKRTKRHTKTNENPFKKAMVHIAAAIKKGGVNLLIFAVTFVLSTVITLIDFALSETDFHRVYSDYEVGQIADKTIIADCTIVGASSDGIAVIEGEKIIRKGFAVDETAYKKLMMLAERPVKFDSPSFWYRELYSLLVLLVAVLLLNALKSERPLLVKEAVFLSALFLVVYAMAALMSDITFFSSPYTLVSVVPSSLCIMLVTILISPKAGKGFSLLYALGVLGASSFNVLPFVFVLVTCLCSVRLVAKMEKRIDFIQVSLFLGLIHGAVLLVLATIFRQNPFPLWACLAGTFFSGFISGILTLGFLTPLESLLNTVTMFRLMDLSDLNSSIMKHMLLSAPGTYSHSMMVATLAESACRSISANPLLARVGAYYHDLGKLEQPEYFVENQSANNKHDEINPRLSVSVIRRHVKKGVEKAYQLRLPQEVIDIIAEHHGNGVISYFYNEAKKLDETVSPDEFSYIGTPPSTKESAVVMLADTVEAACRTLEKPSVPRLEKFIRGLIMHKYEDRQLDKSDLTFGELDTIIEVFVSTLAGYYHSRIEYPGQKDPDQEENEGKASADTKAGGTGAATDKGGVGEKNAAPLDKSLNATDKNGASLDKGANSDKSAPVTVGEKNEKTEKEHTNKDVNQ